MDPELAKAYELMKRYVTYDLESVKEIDMAEWQNDFEDTEEWEPAHKVKEKPFSYDNMLTSVMEYLESVGGVEFAVLKDPELGRWWSKKVKKREHEKNLKAAKEKLYSTMSKEELKILGINVK